MNATSTEIDRETVESLLDQLGAGMDEYELSEFSHKEIGIGCWPLMLRLLAALASHGIAVETRELSDWSGKNVSTWTLVVPADWALSYLS